MTALETWMEGLFRPATGKKLSQLHIRSYWVQLLETLLPSEQLDRALSLDKSCALLLWGEPGNGRQTAALALAASLADHDYRFAHLTGSDLSDNTEKKLSYLFSRMGEDQPMVVLCQDLDGCENSRLCMDALGLLFQTCREENYPVIFLVIAEDLQQLSPALLRQVQACRFTAPDLQDRQNFFEKSLSPRFPLGKGLRHLDLARETEGLTLAQLRQCLYFMQLALKQDAVRRYRDRAADAVYALQTGDLCLELSVFRDIVRHVKLPPKEQVQSTPAQNSPTITPLSQDNNGPSEADNLRNSSSMSDFLANL